MRWASETRPHLRPTYATPVEKSQPPPRVFMITQIRRAVDKKTPPAGRLVGRAAVRTVRNAFA